MKTRTTFAEKINLAKTYLEDGAPYSAARLLREAADQIERQAKRYNAALGRAMDKADA